MVTNRIKWLIHLIIFASVHAVFAQPRENKPQVLVLTERGDQHESFVAAALNWLDSVARDRGFEITVINRPDNITDEFLTPYDLFLQLNFPPYTWPPRAEEAFQRYIEEGRGGWIGFHHATLLGDFDGYPMWKWFSDFMGGIQFKNYIASRASGMMHVEDPKHPVMSGVPAQFDIPDEEWYTFDRSPRPNVRVLATVDESSYRPSSGITMGDHPVIWSNERVKAQNVYFLIGHHGGLFRSTAFTRMFENALLWASGHTMVAKGVSND